MRIKSFAYSLAVVVFCMTPKLVNAAGPGDFSLKNGDTVVMYGDSITEQTLYTQWVELYTVTRFPQRRITFYGAGVGGDKVTGGGGGKVDDRLARDVFSHSPTAVTVMLGMNDGNDAPNSDVTEAVYTKGYVHILESIRAHAPEARITVIGPSPKDDVTRSVQFPGGYNLVLKHYADLDQELARKYEATFVNMNPPLVALLEKAEAADPLMAELILPDRTHPDVVGHWVMAETLLKGWNAPALVSSVTIDARALKAEDTKNASVDGVERDQETLSWTETEGSLPLPLYEYIEPIALLMQLTDFKQQMNQEPLRLTGLRAGQYNLAIDGHSMGSFSADELAVGINLADLSTPMKTQARQVGWIVRDRDQAQQIHMRMLMDLAHVNRMHMATGNADTEAQEGKPDVFDTFENSMEDLAYKMAVPKPHKFQLSRVVAQP
jgi:lysophospholipase L1-like esterase